nr:hypothetical protein B0A51_02821 [Rachicladosporium sp. CCFEE 5018]
MLANSGNWEFDPDALQTDFEFGEFVNEDVGQLPHANATLPADLELTPFEGTDFENAEPFAEFGPHQHTPAPFTTVAPTFDPPPPAVMTLATPQYNGALYIAQQNYITQGMSRWGR